MPDNDPIGAAIADAHRRLEASTKGSREAAQAHEDLIAAERTQRAARRAAGENVLSEEARQRTVTMGDFEDTMKAVQGAFDRLNARIIELEAKAKSKAKR